MKIKIMLTCLGLSACTFLCADQQWPQQISMPSNSITIFPPQPFQMNDGILFSRAAVAILQNSQTTTLHGVAVILSNMSSNPPADTVTLDQFHIQNIQISNIPEQETSHLLPEINSTASTWKQQIAPETLAIMLNLAEQSNTTEKPNEIPRTTTVKNNQDLNVTYNGQPRFVPIPQTRLRYAENSDFQVIKDQTTYYCADRGVWYLSSAADGPWQIARKVPTDLQKIPPSSPMYNTRFLYVGNQTNEEVSFGFYPGYMAGRFRWGRLGGWALDSLSPDYSLRLDPYGRPLQYPQLQPKPRQQKNWGRDYSKFPEFSK